MRFRDPLNKERRFIPLRLDDAHIKGSLAQFLCVNWQPVSRDHEYPKLLQACLPPAPMAPLLEAQQPYQAIVLSLRRTNGVRSVAWSPDGQRALSGASHKTLRLWDMASGRCVRFLKGHTNQL